MASSALERVMFRLCKEAPWPERRSVNMFQRIEEVQKCDVTPFLNNSQVSLLSHIGCKMAISLDEAYCIYAIRFEPAELSKASRILKIQL